MRRLGAATSFTAFNIAALSGARRGEEGLASGLINTSTQVGGPVGLAIAVTIVGVVSAAVGGSAVSSTVDGFRYAFIGGAVLSGIGFVLASSIRRPKLVVMSTEQLMEPIGAPVAPASPARLASESEVPPAMKKILVAVDGSENGERAARAAVRFAKDYGAELEVLRVFQAPTAVTPSTPRAGGAGSTILKEYYDFAENDAEAYVNSLVKTARDGGVSVIRGEVLRTTGSPADAITERAKTEGFDLIVIGTRGLSPSRRLFLGSVSGAVVAGAGMAVLVVK